MLLEQISSRQGDETFVETFSRLVKQSGLRQAEIVRRTNEQISSVDDDDLGLMISPVSETMLSYLLHAKRNISAQELRKICRFGLGLSREVCDHIEMLRQQDRDSQAPLPIVEPETEPSIPNAGYPHLPDWLCP